MSTRSFGDELDSLHAISVQIAALRDVSEIYDRALSYCLDLTGSAMGFVGLLGDDGYAMDVVAVKGFQATDPDFYSRFRQIPARPSVFGVVITEQRSTISNDVRHDPLSVGWPPGHPDVQTFLGVPLRLGDRVIGMVGVSNKSAGYDSDDERLLATFANQVAVAIDNARLYERQRETIERTMQLQVRLSRAEREQLLALERDRIAAGLHDEIQQDLFSAGMHVTGLLERDLDAPVAARLMEIRQIIARATTEMRDVIFALAIEGHGDLTGSVQKLLETTSAAGIETDLVVTGTSSRAVSRVQGAVHAVVKEALANVVKHARASMVLVSIRYADDRLDVVIQDDGVGAPAAVLRASDERDLHFGIANMRRQILALAGSLVVANGEEGGVTVSVSVPLVTGSAA